MSILLSFPPELLTHIFLLAVTSGCPPLYPYYRFQQENLCSFALVKSRWTSIAQKLMLEEVEVKGDGEFMQKKVKQISELQTRHKTKRLEIRTNIDGFLEVAELDRWEGVVFVRCGNVRWISDTKAQVELNLSVELEPFAQLPSLRALWLEYGKFKVTSLGPNTSFRNLSRLVVGSSTALIGDLSHFHEVFSPETTPNLFHLSLNTSRDQPIPFATIFSLILPQIRTLVINSNTSYEQGSNRLLCLVHTLPSLSHLAIITTPFSRFCPHLFPRDARTFNLESLHLNSDVVQSDDLLSTTLAAIVRGEKEGFQIGRIVVYDHLEEGMLQTPERIDRINRIEGIEKREDMFAALADFDGR